jgi:hypothetical protein
LTDISEACVASIVRVEELSKQEKQVASRSGSKHFHHMAVCCLSPGEIIRSDKGIAKKKEQIM